MMFASVISGSSASTLSTSGPSISSHTDPVQPGDTATITVNDSSLVSGVDFGPVTGFSFTAPTGTTIEYTVPDAYANGLAFGSQTVTVTDGTNTDTISVTLDAPTAVDFEGTVSGFDSLDASAESSLEDTSITVVDGDYQVVRDPNNIIDTFRANGAHTYSTTGSIFLRVLDVSDTTDSPQGTWTNEREVVIDSAVSVSVSGTVQDRVQTALNFFEGTIQDRMFKELGNRGFTGTLDDRVKKAGGWKQFLSDLGI